MMVPGASYLVQQFVNEISTDINGLKIERFFSDCGRDFMNKDFDDFLGKYFLKSFS